MKTSDFSLSDNRGARVTWIIKMLLATRFGWCHDHDARCAFDASSKARQHSPRPPDHWLKLRAARDRFAGVLDRPLQSAMHLLHARRGSAVVGRRAAAATRRNHQAGANRRGQVEHNQGEVHRCRTVAGQHLDEIIAATAARRPRLQLALTTNGVSLAELAATLAQAGLNRVNVSLDSVITCTSRRSPAVTGWPTCWPAWPPCTRRVCDR